MHGKATVPRALAAAVDTWGAHLRTGGHCEKSGAKGWVDGTWMDLHGLSQEEIGAKQTRSAGGDTGLRRGDSQEGAERRRSKQRATGELSWCDMEKAGGRHCAGVKGRKRAQWGREQGASGKRLPALTGHTGTSWEVCAAKPHKASRVERGTDAAQGQVASAEGAHADGAAQRTAAAATAATAADARHRAVVVGSAVRGSHRAGLACPSTLRKRCRLRRRLLRHRLRRRLLRLLRRLLLLRLLCQVWVVQAEVQRLQQPAQTGDGIGHHHVIVALGAHQQLHYSQHALADCGRVGRMGVGAAEREGEWESSHGAATAAAGWLRWLVKCGIRHTKGYELQHAVLGPRHAWQAAPRAAAAKMQDSAETETHPGRCGRTRAGRCTQRCARSARLQHKGEPRAQDGEAMVARKRG